MRPFRATLLRSGAKTLQSVGFEADTRSMSGRVTAALICALALALPATASAQAAPDEHAAARAFTDVAIRAVAGMEAASATVPLPREPRCPASRRLAKRATGAQQHAVFELYNANYIGRLTRATTPVLARTVAELNAVPTADPLLQRGRAAWGEVHTVYSRLRTFPHVHVCVEMRKYVRSNFRKSALMRRAHGFLRRANGWDTTDIDRALARAEKRLVALGVPVAEADAFDGDYDRASSSLKSLRAAR
jgi:hypothetical protein